MTSSLSNYDLLIQKLDGFIRKYYKNQLLRGVIYSFTALLAFFLVLTLLESFAWFSPAVRSVLFYVYLLGTAFIVYRLILIPISHLYKLGHIISHAEAARIVGAHFPTISDKLLNTLQLKELAGNSTEQSELIYASINQKSAELKPIPFASAVDFSKNKKYLRYAAIPALVLLFIVIAAPSLITDSTNRLFHHTTYFKKPAPFDFKIVNNKLEVVQYDDYNLQVKLTGKEIPQEVYVEVNGNQFKLDKENTVTFNYTFRKVQKSIGFRLMADGYSSDDHELKAFPNPVVTQFSIDLKYPAYLGKPAEQLKNTGDLILPAGTVVTWNFATENTSQFRMAFQDTSFNLGSGDEKYSVTRRLLHNNSYSVHTANQYMQNRDSMSYTVNVVPDMYPSIEVSQQEDSTSFKKLYFHGLVKDDYGLSKLQFRYRFLKSSDSLPHSEELHVENISINHSTQDQFFHYWDLAKVNLQPGDELEYYFEVSDNDGVNGNKSSRSQSNIFKAPTDRELAEDKDKKNKELKDDLSEGLSKAKKLQKDMNQVSKEMLNKKNLDYEDKKKISDLLEQQKQLEEKVKEIQEKSSQNQQKQSEFRKENEELAEKQRQLQELFDKLMSPEMKEMMKELEKLMAQIDKQQLQEMMDKMKLENKDLQKEMDRALELFKQLELEQKLKETTENLEKLAKDQEKLAEKSADKNSDAKDLEKEQKDLGQKFDELKKDLDDIEKKNQELEDKKDLGNTDEDQKNIEEDMKQSEQQLGEGKKSKASKSQKSASEKMQQMADKMKKAQEADEAEQNEEDAQAMRALLENILRFSFDQEALMEDLKSIDINNPRYLKLSQQQRKLKDDAGMIEDSLLALSKRVIQIQSAVNEQITAINDNAEKAIANLQDRIVPQARSNQQYIMTAANNLALMLSESLNQMQQQMMSQKPGDGKCKKPGKGKPGPSASDLKKMQEKLSQQLKDMKGKMQNGKKPGEKPGEKQGMGIGMPGMSEELARMAAQQEAIRNALQELNNTENKDGQGKLGDLGKIAKQMEENEKDIVNKRITEETLNRQQDILTRLLESEKAERERDQEERRESNEAKNNIYRNPPQFEEYKKLQIRETELLKTIPPSLTTFYKNLVNSYFQSIEN